jgi:hypothetical protein
LGVGIAKYKKFPVPFGERPIDIFCVEAIGGLAFTNSPAGVDSVTASPPDVILKLVCNGLPGILRFLSEHQINRYIWKCPLEWHSCIICESITVKVYG